MLLFGLQNPRTLIIFAIVIILAFAYHEYAHALVADRLGDPTPRMNGRLTLNPLPHLSWFGLLTLFLFGFGGAYTPVNPRMLRGNMRQSYALVAIAGPAANLIMAALFALAYRVTAYNFDLPGVLYEFMLWGVRLNIFLLVFNLMPIPPLDGFSILQGVLPAEIAYQLEPLRQYGLIFILVAFLLLPRLGVDLFGNFLFPAVSQLETLLLGFPL